MNNVLKQICAAKRKHIADKQAVRSLDKIKNDCRSGPQPRGFLKALKQASRNGYGLISEIKRSSPSKGLIRKDFNPANLASAYQAGGATCISVLTDKPYFNGDDKDLIEARNAVDLPVLRKDFMLEPYQIYESRALGADCILLIMAALSQADAIELEDIAYSHGMDVLIEIHNQNELERALKLKSSMIGINNRDLKTLETNISTTQNLARFVPKDKTIISESGLNTPKDLAGMALEGVRCFLIGESLMRQNNVTTAVKNLLANPIQFTTPKETSP